MKALGWNHGAPKLPETIDEARSNDEMLVDFLKNVEPSLSSEQYEKFCKLSIDHEFLLFSNPDSDKPESAETRVNPAASYEKMAGLYEYSYIERPTDLTLPQNRPNSSNSDLETAEAAYQEGLLALQEWYKHLSMMELLEKRDNDRGGPGRVSWEEFEGVMKGPKAEELKFLGSWLEMAVF